MRPDRSGAGEGGGEGGGIWTTREVHGVRDVGGRSEVVAKASLDPAFELLLRFFRGRLGRSGPWETGEGHMIDEWNVEYFLGHYRELIAFMTDTLWPPPAVRRANDVVIVRITQ